ncbi:hypothetical protein, partial [Streptomyces sp. NPDC059802]|uniref:hypothetical protein n=1 Tax=Streptomyces sp. NPDC059802 TaxID=3346952 RepID=UPI003666B638
MTTSTRTFWIRINPQGHIEGSVHGEYVGPLAEDAHKQFTPRVRDRRREAAEGYQHELVTRDEWSQRAELCLLGPGPPRKAAHAPPGRAEPPRHPPVPQRRSPSTR